MRSRLLDIDLTSSFFLLGPRGCGKTTLLRKVFSGKEMILFDLLDKKDFIALTTYPEEILNRAKSLTTGERWVVIDEVQKIPDILDYVHKLIEEEKIKFALTGSSARKLKKSGVNLLAGRAVIFNLFPFTWLELESDFELDPFLSWGGLPLVVNASSEKQKARILKAYAETYLHEEIAQERIVRSLEPFQRFLEVAVQMSGHPLNYSAIARDCMISDNGVRDYFSILEETLIGFTLPAYSQSTRKQMLLGSPKFYFFDTGVERALKQDLRGPLPNDRQLIGRYFESFVINQIKALNSYYELDYQLYHARASNGLEADLVIERQRKELLVIEIKATDFITANHLTQLTKLKAYLPPCRLLCLSQDPNRKEIEGVTAIHWTDGIKGIMDESI